MNGTNDVAASGGPAGSAGAANAAVSEGSAGKVRFALALAVLALLGLHAASHLPFLADDALISLRYARRLLGGLGLTWTDGERVEGYSNLLWVLCTAGLGALGVDLIDAARLLGVLGAGVAAVGVALAEPARTWRAALPGAFAGLAVAGSGPVAVWSIGGLEQPMVAALVVLGVVTAYPLAEPGARIGKAFVPGAFFALLAITRPDGALFAVAVALGVVWSRGFDRRGQRLALALLALPALFYIGQLGFRLSYYGEWVPNTAHAKLAFSASRLGGGLAYVGTGLLWLAGLVLPAFALLPKALRGERGGRVRIALVPLLLWLGYVAVIGGDIFPARRHVAAAVPLFGLLAAHGFAAWMARPGARLKPIAWSAAAALALLMLLQFFDPENQRARDERWEWDGQVVGLLLKRAFAEQAPLLAVDPAGTLPYFSELPSLDMLGLNDRHLAKHPPANLGEGWVGHELGDGGYVLDRNPDLVIMSTPAGGPRPRFRSAKEMAQDPRMMQQFRLVTFEGDEPYVFRSGIFVRREGGAIGIARAEAEVTVPGYLLCEFRGSVARLDGEGRIGVTVTREAPAGIGALPLPVGSWQVAVEASGDSVSVRVLRAGTNAVIADGEGKTFAVGAPGVPDARVDVQVVAPNGSAHVRRVVFRRGG